MGRTYFSKTYRQPLEALRRRSQGVFILHHAMTAFPHWPTGSICAESAAHSTY